MEPHLFAEIAVNRFNNRLSEYLFNFIRTNTQLAEMYKKTEQRYSKRVVNNVLNDFLVKALQEDKPIFFTDDPEFSQAEELLVKVANEFIAQLTDQVFISIENDRELLAYVVEHYDQMPLIQQNIREELIEFYHVIPTGVIEEVPLSNLLNKYRRMMLKSDEEM
ncbi:MAG: hypothetical protein RR202_02215 [Bacteroidales bacterium]